MTQQSNPSDLEAGSEERLAVEPLFAKEKIDSA